MRVLYHDTECTLKINGELCGSFKLHRGIRQGYPLSIMLYSLVIEPLLMKLRAKLQDVSIPKCKNTFKLAAYANDVIIFVSCQRDVDIMLKIFEDFNFFSSAKVNWEKCIAMLIGRWPNGTPNLSEGLS